MNYRCETNLQEIEKYLRGAGIKMHADVHNLVLDPFAGLGSTLIACEQSGRRCRAIEADALHCDLIVRRWEQFTGEQAIRL